MMPDQWHPALLFIAKVLVVPATLWLSYVVGFIAGIKMGGPDDIRQTYTAVFGVVAAWLVTVPVAVWLLGWQAFSLGAVLGFTILWTLKRHRRRR
jgi:hypothetical protein